MSEHARNLDTWNDFEDDHESLYADYPESMDAPDETEGIATLPDGRRIRVVDAGSHEMDTGAFVSFRGYPQFYWHGGERDGERLSVLEMNERVVAATTHGPEEDLHAYVHEYAIETADWQSYPF